MTEALSQAAGRPALWLGDDSAKQVFDRLAGCLDLLGLEGWLFRPPRKDASGFPATSCGTCSPCRWSAPNSPQWFNTGLFWAYGIDGPSQGHFYVDFQTNGKLVKSKSSYEHPQPHACFIQSVADDLVNEGGIMDLWVREARLVQIWFGHRLELLDAAWREAKSFRRWRLAPPASCPS